MYILDKHSKRLVEAEKCTFKSLNFTERHDLQEWIAKEPSSLGEDLLIYNRQNELYIFLKRKVHFSDTFSHENEQLISQLLIFYNRVFSAAFQACFNALSMSFQIQCKSVEPQKPFSKTNQA